jgi:hypothetical protein
MDPPHHCAADDINAEAFEKATKIIGGRDTVEEFLACSILALSGTCDLEVKKAEVPLSKVVVPLPKAPMTNAVQVTDADFEVSIAKAANCLVGNYI